MCSDVTSCLPQHLSQPFRLAGIATSGLQILCHYNPCLSRNSGNHSPNIATDMRMGKADLETTGPATLVIPPSLEMRLLLKELILCGL